MNSGPYDPAGECCWICGEVNCLDHQPVDDVGASQGVPPKTNGRDHEAEAAAHQIILTAQETSRERARRDARRILDVEARGPWWNR